jgi:hypothetical protein
VKPPSTALSSRKGLSSVLVIVVLPSVLMLSWLAIEVGVALSSAADARNGADAIALAAAARHDESFTAAVEDAQTAAGANRSPAGTISISVGPGPAGGGDLEFGRWDRFQRQFVPDPEGGRAVRATVRFAEGHANGVPGLLLPSLFPGTVVNIERQSVAVFVPPKHLVSALLLGDGNEALEVERAARLRTRGCVLVASSEEAAVRVAGAPRVLVAELRVAGGFEEGSVELVDSDVVAGATIPADPYASIPLPPLDSAPPQPIEHDDLGTTFVHPGVHSGFDATGGRIVLLPGLHQFEGPIVLSADAVLELDAATLLFSPVARLTLSDRAQIVGSPSESVPGWEEFWILQETGARTWSFTDTAEIDLKGRIYAPTTRLVLEGSSRIDSGTLVAESVRVRGDAVLRLRESIEALESTPVPGRAKLVR